MNDVLDLEKLITDLVYSDSYQPVKPRAIAKKLKLLGDEKNVTRAIKKLTFGFGIWSARRSRDLALAPT